MILLKKYIPHDGQIAFHLAVRDLYRYVLMLCGIRGGKTHAGAREALKQCWNSKVDKNIPYGIIAPTYHMLDRTTWREFKRAARPLIKKDNDTKKIITLKNGREVFGFSAENYDKIRNVTLMGFWGDEAREWKNFAEVWDVLLGRVLSTGGKGIITSSPNSFDDMHKIFIEERREGYGTVRFTTYENKYIPSSAIDELKGDYDEKFAQQELMGEIVTFDGQVYYAFNRKDNAGDIALKKAQYNPHAPLRLSCDFNVDPMAWEICQFGVNQFSGLPEVYWIDEIYLRNSNTVEACREFKSRYPVHMAGLYIYGDATGKARSTNSNVTNWQIIKEELGKYGVHNMVLPKNPAERDRVNSTNAMLKNSAGVVRTFINPNKCKHLIRDCEQVSYKEGSVQIDKTKNFDLTHPSDAAGYLYDREFGISRDRIESLKF
jgi:hypothetical protein